MKLVIDASVALKWLRHWSADEPDRDRAVAILASLESGAAIAYPPPHWKAETLAVMARKEPDRVTDAQSLSFRVPHEIAESDAVYSKAAALAVKLKHHLFDTLYNAMALENDATLVTANEAFFSEEHRVGNIKLLATLGN